MKILKRGWVTFLLLVILSAEGCNTKSPENTTWLTPSTTRLQGVIPTKVEPTQGGFRLVRGGKPYYLRGGAGVQQIDRLREAGGNTLRLWSSDFAEPFMDEAHQAGLSVMLGLWMEPETSHFTYYDPAMVEAQLGRIRQQVLRYRHHPALLMWNVGNEVDISARGPRLFSALGRIAHMIHELDPYHPVTTTLGDLDSRAAELHHLAPEVDILSFNIYGKLRILPTLLRNSGWLGPYIISEYGNAGYWEEAETKWGAQLEKTSTAKAVFVSSLYRQVIEPDSNKCLGSYLFFWGSKFEYTSTWFSLFEPTGEKTALVDEMNYLWRGQYPTNRAPLITDLQLAGRRASASIEATVGQLLPSIVEASDPEGDSLTVHWELLPEVEKTFDAKIIATPPESVENAVISGYGFGALIKAPQLPGPYRLYVRVFDGHGSVATANIPFWVRTVPPTLVGTR
ncbi:glycoside hydrolase family 2 TIM barrel-domain containing protein [Hymenobacter siberiensis]|uniref:glycoside hydrolase family 2 TIM barrel-domain containing protein n=1 Tax=Hymenobacter siberiensis TaxID=2848396 RepID=UPI001C1E3936|nr:glycoside hydrolase family 2 TIM barrel-domain containing protein [Hymenobacter siberiensis]